EGERPKVHPASHLPNGRVRRLPGSGTQPEDLVEGLEVLHPLRDQYRLVGGCLHRAAEAARTREDRVPAAAVGRARAAARLAGNGNIDVGRQAGGVDHVDVGALEAGAADPVEPGEVERGPRRAGSLGQYLVEGLEVLHPLRGQHRLIRGHLDRSTESTRTGEDRLTSSGDSA